MTSKCSNGTVDVQVSFSAHCKVQFQWEPDWQANGKIILSSLIWCLHAGLVASQHKYSDTPQTFESIYCNFHEQHIHSKIHMKFQSHSLPFLQRSRENKMNTADGREIHSLLQTLKILFTSHHALLAPIFSFVNGIILKVEWYPGVKKSITMRVTAECSSSSHHWTSGMVLLSCMPLFLSFCNTPHKWWTASYHYSCTLKDYFSHNTCHKVRVTLLWQTLGCYSSHPAIFIHRWPSHTLSSQPPEMLFLQTWN